MFENLKEKWPWYWYKTIVSREHLQTNGITSSGWKMKPSAELELWLRERKPQYRFKQNEYTGAIWIEFKNKEIATLCRLTFG